MQVIQLSAKGWKSIGDFYDALARAQYEHDGRATSNARNINALLELLVWDVGQADNSPYVFRVTHVSGLPAEVREEIDLAKILLAKAREESISRRGIDVRVRLDLID